MKQILISIKPKWVAKIFSGGKTLEIRKTAPKEWVCLHNGKIKKNPEPMLVYIYCTKSDYIGCLPKRYVGKVVAKFTLKDVYTICNYPALCKTCIMSMKYIAEDNAYRIGSDSVDEHSHLKDMGLSHLELDTYLKGKIGYAWHISDLQIFDEPKDLSEFLTLPKKIWHDYESMSDYYERREYRRLKRAPQSWCYVEENK